MSNMGEEIGVPEVFKGKNVFLTGGTGFLGKVLIEKLLRSCPDIGKIYVLMRPRKTKSIQDRLDDMSKLELFGKLHAQREGDFAKKVVPINGDVAELRLGLSKEDYELLTNEVHFVYHVAASVKFDQALKDAILMNTRGTREVCRLTLQMKHIQLLIHVSTAYAHTQYNPIEEKMYPATADWKKTIKAAEKLGQFEMNKIQAQFMGPFPNTYTFTKGLAERVVHDTLHGKVPNMIIRPSIVISSWKDPMPGWIDNFNGPVGMLAANGTGLIRINLLKDTTSDFLPVDLATRALLNAAWHRIAHSNNYEKNATSVHNCSANSFAKMTAYDIAQMAYDLAEVATISTCVWYPTLRRTESHTVYNIYFLFLHVIPALFFDLVLRILKYRPIVLMIQRRIFVAVNALKFFILNEWAIHNHSLAELEYILPEKDREDFAYEADGLDHYNFFKESMLGGMKYLLKEDMSKIEQSRTRIKILKYVDIIFTILLYGGLFYYLFIKWDILGWFVGSLGSYFKSLKTPGFS